MPSSTLLKAIPPKAICPRLSSIRPAPPHSPPSSFHKPLRFRSSIYSLSFVRNHLPRCRTATTNHKNHDHVYDQRTALNHNHDQYDPYAHDEPYRSPASPDPPLCSSMAKAATSFASAPYHHFPLLIHRPLSMNSSPLTNFTLPSSSRSCIYSGRRVWNFCRAKRQRALIMYCPTRAWAFMPNSRMDGFFIFIFRALVGSTDSPSCAYVFVFQ